jgi:hypothetical protein
MEITTNGGEQKMGINHLHQAQLLDQQILFQDMVILFTDGRIGLMPIVVVNLE